MLQDNIWYAYDVRQNFSSIYFVPMHQTWGAIEMMPTVLTYIDCILVRHESEDQGTLLAHYLIQNGWKKNISINPAESPEVHFLFIKH